MTGYLLDTNVISMFAPTTQQASSAFVDWVEQADRDGELFLSAVTVHELEKGVALLDRKGAVAKADKLRDWIAGLLAIYDDRILAIDTKAAAISGQLEAMAIGAGHHPGMADALIAGTAKAHDLAVVTNNRKHFEPFGVSVLTPNGAGPAG